MRTAASSFDSSRFFIPINGDHERRREPAAEVTPTARLTLPGSERVFRGTSSDRRRPNFACRALQVLSAAAVSNRLLPSAEAAPARSSIAGDAGLAFDIWRA